MQNSFRAVVETEQHIDVVIEFAALHESRGVGSEFFDLQAGLKLAIWPRLSISHDTGLAPSAPSPTEFTLGHNVASKPEVDAIMRQAQSAGAVIVKPAHETFWGGYAGY